MPLNSLDEKYTVEKIKCGEGGQSTVFRCWSKTDLDRRFPLVAKKFKSKNVSERIERLQREIQALSKLEHESIVKVVDYDVFALKGPYLILSYVEGMTLDSFVEENRDLSYTRIIEIAVSLTKAIKYCHERQVLHRDIKPDNIIISRNGVPVLIDFGLSYSVMDSNDFKTESNEIRSIEGTVTFE